jgi:hypothetical protein
VDGGGKVHIRRFRGEHQRERGQPGATIQTGGSRKTSSGQEMGDRFQGETLLHDFTERGKFYWKHCQNCHNCRNRRNLKTKSKCTKAHEGNLKSVEECSGIRPAA